MFKYLLVLVFMFISINLYCQNTFIQEGLASYYADKFEGRTTANGEIYKHSEYTASHLTLPFGTKVKVTNLSNNVSVVVRINDRGPFIKGRIIDVSKSVAQKLDFIESGLVNVKIETIKDTTSNTDIKNIDKELALADDMASYDIEQEISKNNNLYYSFDVNIVSPHGYGIQIGSFKEMANLAKLTERIKTHYNKSVIVQVNKINGEKIYRVIVGTFSTKQEAENYKSNFIKELSDCFVVKF